MSAATGSQYLLTLDADGHSVRAIVTELAAGIRMLERDGHALVEHYGEDEIAPQAAGIVLVPWPNRIAGGRWTYRGAVQQLDITEPALGNASHGLLRNTGYRLVEQEAHRSLQTASVFPQHGYPFHLETFVEHALTSDGMTVTHTLVNRGETEAPVAVGAHPYLRVGDTPLDDCTLTVRAERRLVVDAAQIPTGSEGVAGTDADLSGGRRVADLDVNHAYAGLAENDGRFVQTLTAPDGRVTELWADPDFGYVQVFTPRSFPPTSGGRRAVALEPMTAPADAFNSGEGLRWLAPGESWTLSWGIRGR
ncbi:aldose 1-epimerase [Cnuibacter physcomitrellae]|nr:aldose 1-epimerase family protein [Cnuibacter physcomitrellae]GGI42119.1 aldose 1-epimerase [Cnuibacter physcomitrellae]